MDGASISEVESGVQDNLRAMISRGKSVSSYLNRVLVQKYQKAQDARWETEGASEGETWMPLDPAYAKYKRKKFASYQGAGGAMMIATGRLSSGARLKDASYGYKIVTDDSFTVGINLGALPYAKYPGVMRPYMEFSDATLADWKLGIRDYICKNKGGL